MRRKFRNNNIIRLGQTAALVCTGLLIFTGISSASSLEIASIEMIEDSDGVVVVYEDQVDDQVTLMGDGIEMEIDEDYGSFDAAEEFEEENTIEFEPETEPDVELETEYETQREFPPLQPLVPVQEFIPEGYKDIDFWELWDQNSDIYAWIDIPGTGISYPVLQSAYDMEEDFYLNHNLDHSAGYPGCIFTEKINEQDFTDIITVLYGHNMRDGSMFGSLHNFCSEDYMREHSEIDIYTMEGLYRYEIIAGVVYDNRHVIYNYGLWNLNRIQDYINSIYMPGDYPEESAYNAYWGEIDVNRDTFLVLSTCVGGGRHDNRFLLTARLVSAPYDSDMLLTHKREELWAATAFVDWLEEVSIVVTKERIAALASVLFL